MDDEIEYEFNWRSLGELAEELVERNRPGEDKASWVELIMKGEG